MRFLKLKFIPLVLLWLFFIPCSAQQKHKITGKHVPFFISHNAAKLTRFLTKDLKSDSEKVVAIHDWIASYIRYDARKWLSHDYRQVPIKRILRSRKAICMGYSQLFEAMCNYAGIQCVKVQGYDKDMEVDVNDHEFLDEHIWNAVYINGQWKLVDVCWDAGDIKLTKRTLKGFFIHLFSGGKKDHVKYHPHFINGGNDFYCMRSGKFFATDHLPLNPIWQLTYPVKSIAQFETDSAYYYKRYDTTADLSGNNMTDETKRREYMAKSDDDKTIEDGFVGYTFNNRNHYEKGISYYLMAQKLMPRVHQSDTNGMMVICDSLLALLDTGKTYIDTSGNYMQVQKRELMETNKKKREIMMSQDTRLIKDTRSMMNDFRKQRVEAYNYSEKLKKLTRSRIKNIHILAKDRSVGSSAKKHSPSDSLAYAISIKIYRDSILQEETRLQYDYSSVDIPYNFAKKSYTTYSDTDIGVIKLALLTQAARWNGYDDLDYEVRRPKDSLIRVKYKNDSTLFIDKQHVIIPLYTKYNSLIASGNILFNMYKTQLHMIKKMASFCLDDKFCQRQYDSTVARMITLFTPINKTDMSYVNTFRGLRNYFKVWAEVTDVEAKFYLYDKIVENLLYAARKHYIIAHTRGLINAKRGTHGAFMDDRRVVLKYRSRLKRPPKPESDVH